MNDGPMSPDNFRAEMGLLNMGQDAEREHELADHLLCELLESLGYKEGVEVFRAMNKYYA